MHDPHDGHNATGLPGFFAPCLPWSRPQARLEPRRICCTAPASKIQQTPAEPRPIGPPWQAAPANCNSPIKPPMPANRHWPFPCAPRWSRRSLRPKPAPTWRGPGSSPRPTRPSPCWCRIPTSPGWGTPARKSACRPTSGRRSKRSVRWRKTAASRTRWAICRPISATTTA